jgi:5'-nucleotidase
MPDKKAPPPNTSVTYKSESSGRAPDLRLLHYNDVYHVDASSNEPVGGVARFMGLINQYRDDAKYQGQPSLLTFFSGDALNPSLESSVTKGMSRITHIEYTPN